MIGSRKTITVWLGTPVFVGFLGYCAPLAAQELSGPTPSTVAYERIYYEVPSGEQRGIKQSVFAVRSDGATCEAVRRRAPDGQRITVRTIRDPARKAMIGIDESTRSLVTFGL